MPSLSHPRPRVEECIRTAQAGGVGLIVYNRKEGRALGEVTKFLVYNARKRQPGGDQAATYSRARSAVAGVQDAPLPTTHARRHSLARDRANRSPRIDVQSQVRRLIASGIVIGERVALPPDSCPRDAMVEIEAKKAAGYFTPESGLAALGEKPADGNRT